MDTGGRGPGARGRRCPVREVLDVPAVDLLGRAALRLVGRVLTEGGG